MLLYVHLLTICRLALDPRWWLMTIVFPQTKPEKTSTHGSDGTYETILSPTTISNRSASSNPKL